MLEQLETREDGRPSHLTLIQASRMLGIPKSTIHYNMRPGGKLEAQTWYGVRMIPMWRIAAFVGAK